MSKGHLIERVSFVGAAAALMLGSVVPVAAQETGRSYNKQAVEKKEPRYCVMSELTGSRIRSKLCKTREAWLKEDGYDPVTNEQRDR
ncbi:hypothetical protein DMC47_12635 [Nostoc sp. 3335mG]|nr:hypothetical protein DMC47_12635 [Nostoc sp. 3335mG]